MQIGLAFLAIGNCLRLFVSRTHIVPENMVDLLNGLFLGMGMATLVVYLRMRNRAAGCGSD